MNRVSTMGELAASLAHEVLHPIATARNNARAGMRFLEMSPPNLEEVKDALGCVVRDADRAKDIVGRMRDHVKKAPPRKERFDLNEAVSEVIAMVRNAIATSGIVVSTHLVDGLVFVQGDRVQLQQVTFNLIRNGSDAMVSVEDRPRQLLVRTQRDGDDRVRLSVQDAGCGVSPQDFERLFEAFYTTKTGGMGIGLSVSRSIIERHQGRLWAEPNNGPGTTFFFSIPCGPGSPKDAAA